MKKLFLLLLILPTLLFAYPKIPKTSGSLCNPNDPDFKEYRYKEKIPYCERNVSQMRRKKIYAAYGIDWEDRENFTIDHIIPLSIGGSNHDDNLWPEHLYIKCKRGDLEYRLYLNMRDGVITQKNAVDTILNSKFGL